MSVSRPAAVLDACTLIPYRLSTTLLWLAEADLFQPLWSETILDEVERNLPSVGRVTPERAARRISAMRRGFDAEALVDGFEELVSQMRCDPKDQHVLAAAVQVEADAIVTFNIKDFPRAATSRFGVAVLHPDTFLCQLLVEHGGDVVGVLQREVAEFRSPTTTLADLLTSLSAVVPGFAAQAAEVAGC